MYTNIERKQMQYIVTKQIAVDAETPEDAGYKSKTEGTVMAMSVNIRPASATQTQVPGVTAQEKLAQKKQEQK